jgi:hypothetical protein
VLHEVQLPVSSLHWNVLPVSLDVKVKSARTDATVPEGPLVIVVFGAVRSMVQVFTAGVPSTLPALSIARTRNVCEPALSAEYGLGEVHATQLPLSSWHWKVLPVSLAMKEKLAVVDLTLPDIPIVIAVSGATVSTVHVRVAGLPSTLPALSIARTWNVCEP